MDPRSTLTTKLDEIDAQMAEMERPPTETGGISFGKRIGEGTSLAIDRMQQVAVHEKLQLVRADVVRALVKLDEGSYGRCDECDGDIGEARLEARPWSVRCLRHS